MLEGIHRPRKGWRILMHLRNIFTTFCNSKPSTACMSLCRQLDCEEFLSPLRLLLIYPRKFSLHQFLPKCFLRAEFHQSHLAAFYLDAWILSWEERSKQALPLKKRRDTDKWCSLFQALDWYTGFGKLCKSNLIKAVSFINSEFAEKRSVLLVINWQSVLQQLLVSSHTIISIARVSDRWWRIFWNAPKICILTGQFIAITRFVRRLLAFWNNKVSKKPEVKAHQEISGGGPVRFWIIINNV